jgi:bifunctional UDP-N-acetylglucosamine pyrophosphorylase/glucosamine-1-phosphate N-acetyltransferase
VDKIYDGEHRYYNEEDFLTAFSLKQTAMVSEVLRNRILDYHMSHGVQFFDPVSTFVGCDVVISKGVVIGSNNILSGKTLIKSGTVLKGGNNISTSIIGENTTVESSVISDSIVGNNCEIGPFAHIRKGTKVGNECRIGNFVEIKNSVVGSRTKVAHLSYLGDAELGEGCNVGCGTVFCNYDGKKKHRTIVGNGVFIGSNSNLIAPLVVGDGAFIAAGSTITDEVPQKAFAIARQRQVNKSQKEQN